MANRYWVGGTGNWSDATNHWATSSGGTPGAGNLPTASDDAIFDTLSHTGAYTVTIDATTKTCLNLVFGAPASGNVTWAGSVAMQISGSLTLYSGLIRTYTGAITMNAGATGKTLTFAGVTMNSNFTFTTAGSGWTVQDAMNISAKNITLTRGTLNTNGQTITCANLASTNTNTRSLTLGASVLNVSSTIDFTTTTGLTFSAGSSTINFSGSSFITGGLTYGTVNITGANPTITDSATFGTLSRTGTAIKTDTFTTPSQTITGTLTINGNSTTNRILVSSPTIGTASTLTAGTVTVTNADFQDITGAGAGSWNLSAITGGSGDCGGNTSITFTTPATQTWQNASSGNWSTASNWTSRVPLPQDDVSMAKAFGTSQTVTADMPRLGKSIDWTGATWTTALTWTPSLAPTRLFGSLTLISGLTVSGGGSAEYTFSGRSSYTLDTKGITLSRGVIIDAPSGTVTLSGNLNTNNTNTSMSVTVTRGTFNANNFTIDTHTVYSNNSNTRTITMGSGVWTVNGWDCQTSTGITLNANTSTIRFTDTSATGRGFYGGGLTYNIVWWNRGASNGLCTIYQSNTFAELKDTGTAAHTLNFTNGTTQTIGTWSVNGTAGNLITIATGGVTLDTHALVKSGGGTVTGDYLNIQHSVATPLYTWLATNSIDNQAVATAGSGWYFGSIPTPPSSTGAGFFMFASM